MRHRLCLQLCRHRPRSRSFAVQAAEGREGREGEGREGEGREGEGREGEGREGKGGKAKEAERAARALLGRLPGLPDLPGPDLEAQRDDCLRCTPRRCPLSCPSRCPSRCPFVFCRCVPLSLLGGEERRRLPILQAAARPIRPPVQAMPQDILRLFITSLWRLRLFCSVSEMAIVQGQLSQREPQSRCSALSKRVER